MSNETVTYSLEAVLTRIESKIDKIDERLTKLEIGQAELKAELKGDIKVLDEKIVAINAAYEILSDPRLRKDYDNQLIGNSPRSQRTATAQANYHRYKEAVKEDEVLVKPAFYLLKELALIAFEG